MRKLEDSEIAAVSGGMALLAIAEVGLVIYGVASIAYEFVQGFEDGARDGAA
jgi:hypothetical protein